VILFDLNEDDTCHGQVQLYAGPGFRAKFLTNEERQRIYENDMLPLLRGCDLDGALLAAMAKVDAAATPEHAQQLDVARQVNAVIGLLIAPLAALAIVLWGLASWFRHGRDPVYLDDPSIHIPAPPPGLTPAAGAVVRDGRTSRRALTAASLDLAARGSIAFQAEKTGFLGTDTKLGILTFPEEHQVDAVDQAGEPLPPGPPGTSQLDAEAQWRRDRARSRPLDPATSFLDQRLTAIAGNAGYIEPDDMLKLGKDVGGFDKRIEQHVVDNGWFGEPPGTSTRRWVGRGTLVIVAGIIALVAAFNLPSDGLTVLGVALLAAGIVLMILARSMPARTMPGAMIRAMLEAYRRTLEKTMAQARSMNQVVAESAIPLIESPDDAVVWGVALGLQAEVEQVLERTAEDLQQGRATGGYIPIWYGSGSGGTWSGGGYGGVAPGLMGSSPIPNFGGMMAALGTIGNSPSSSGAGGGGFGGGGSGGGGGGAGGGF
jgi:hypothetical protein